MMILCALGNYQPLLRLQTWMLERAIAAQLGSSDLRWGLLALAVNLAAAAWALGRRRLVPRRQGPASRRENPADTMVAAGVR